VYCKQVKAAAPTLNTLTVVPTGVETPTSLAYATASSGSGSVSEDDEVASSKTAAVAAAFAADTKSVTSVGSNGLGGDVNLYAKFVSRKCKSRKKSAYPSHPFTLTFEHVAAHSFYTQHTPPVCRGHICTMVCSALQYNQT
jgi:hypothetical protein